MLVLAAETNPCMPKCKENEGLSPKDQGYDSLSNVTLKVDETIKLKVIDFPVLVVYYVYLYR